MDILIPLILLAVLYLVPELLRRRKPKEYKYPEIPNAPNPPAKLPKAEAPLAFSEKTKSTGFAVKPQENNVGKKPSPVTTNDATAANTPFHLDNTALVNGVIWSEILQPPRAYRPMWQRSKY